MLDILQRPGVRRVFAHDNAAVGVPSFSRGRGAANSRYAERALLLAQSGDLVAVTDPVDADFVAYLAALGVGPGADGMVVVDAAAGAGGELLLGRLTSPGSVSAVAERLADRLTGGDEVRISSYYTSRDAFLFGRLLGERLARAVVVEGGRQEAVELANRKDLVRERVMRLGVPIAPGELVDCRNGVGPRGEAAAVLLHDATLRHIGDTGAVFIRGVRSLMGVDNLRIDRRRLTREVLAQWLTDRPEEACYLVEPLLPVRSSPNVQLWIEDDGAPRLLAVTRQRLDRNLAHRGNAFPYRSPVRNAIVDSAVAITGWLSEEGFRGPLGLDFIEIARPMRGAAAHVLAEVNGRINGATYPIALVERLNQVRRSVGSAPLQAWRSGHRQLSDRRPFSALADDLGDLLYRDSSASGLVPYNTGLLDHGLCYYALVGSGAQELDELEARVRQRLQR